MRHWAWQNAVNVAVAALPKIEGLSDPLLARDASKLKLTIALGLVMWTVMVVSFWVAVD